jgi:hypothetical protein
MEKTMEAYQQRVIDEKNELDGRLAKLMAFIEGAGFANVKPDEQERMQRQARAMHEYSAILGERIENFK